MKSDTWFLEQRLYSETSKAEKWILIDLVEGDKQATFVFQLEVRPDGVQTTYGVRHKTLWQEPNAEPFTNALITKISAEYGLPHGSFGEAKQVPQWTHPTEETCAFELQSSIRLFGAKMCIRQPPKYSEVDLRTPRGRNS